MDPQLNHAWPRTFATDAPVITEVSSPQTTQALGHRIKGDAIVGQTFVPSLERLLAVARLIHRQFQLHAL